VLAAQDLLARLVAFDSTSSRPNQPIADFVAATLDGRGVRVRQLPAGEGKVNVWAEVGPPPTGDGSGLVLTGHLDVVPAGESGWESDPFTLTDRGEHWVGRGACDMKGFLALAIARCAGAAGRELAAPLCLLATADEEVGSLGAQRFVAAPPGPLPRAVLVGEPTSSVAVRQHKGHLRLRLTLTGRAAHSGSPQLGINAIEPMGSVLDALSALRRQLAGERTAASERFPDVPYPALNVGTIAGGAAVNVVPDRCVVELGVRLLPGMGAEGVFERVRGTVATALRDAALTDWHLEVENLSPPLSTPADAPLHRELCTLLTQRESVAVNYSSDGGALAGLGLDCVLWGPGSIEVAHRANEYLPKGEWERAGDLLDALIERFCGTGAVA
jgi:acetylornithine deacetylase